MSKLSQRKIDLDRKIKKHQRERQARRDRFQSIRDLIYGELEAYIEEKEIPLWLHDCIQHIIVDIDGHMRSRKEVLLYKGKVKPTEMHVGVYFQPKATQDKFGPLCQGRMRAFLINTRWGQQLQVPKKFGGKKIEIVVREVK